MSKIIGTIKIPVSGSENPIPLVKLTKPTWMINPAIRNGEGKYNITISDQDYHPYMKLIGWTPVFNTCPDDDDNSMLFVNEHCDYKFKVLPPDKRSDNERVQITQTIRDYQIGDTKAIECIPINPYVKSGIGDRRINKNAFIKGAYYKIIVNDDTTGIEAFIGKLVILSDDLFKIAYIDNENICSNVSFSIRDSMLYMHNSQESHQRAIAATKIKIWEV